MTTPRPFRFGVFCGGRQSREELVSLARKAEDLGYSTLVLADHLLTAMAPIAAMAVAAEATSTLRIGCHVFGNDFRNPVMLAKEAATLDLLSGGRLELGLGTGFWRADYDQSGIPLDPPGVRVGRFAEAVQVMKGAFASAITDEPFSFSGTYYTIRDLRLRTKPVQRPHPPLVIGGGSRRILSLAAREADIVSINNRSTAEGGLESPANPQEAFAQSVEWVRQAANGHAEDSEISTLLLRAVHVSDEGPRHAAEQVLKSVSRLEGRTVDQLLASPKALLGSVDDIIEVLYSRRARFGLSYLVISAESIDALAPVVARLAGK